MDRQSNIRRQKGLWMYQLTILSLLFWSTTSRTGKARRMSSTVHTLVKPSCLLISWIGPWPDTRTRLLWNCLNIFNGLWAITTCSFETYTSSYYSKPFLLLILTSFQQTYTNLQIDVLVVQHVNWCSLNYNNDMHMKSNFKVNFII